MQTGVSHPHSVWLCPAPPATDALRHRIRSLSEISGTAVFEPHVTILGDINGDPARTLAILRDIWPTGSVGATVTGVGQTAAFFMALFLDLDLPPELTLRRADLAAGLGTEAPPFRPHLSLAYGDGPGLRASSLERQMEAEFGRTAILFDRLAVVASAKDVPISEWTEIHGVSL